jgi:serine/threonine-protein kinase HipA
MTELPAYFEQRLIGTIAVTGNGSSFTYDRHWLDTRGAFPISTTMPLQGTRYAPRIFQPWAANLLPESVQLRTVGQLLGTAPSDVIGLLSAIGRDTAGALSIGKFGGTSLLHWRAIEREEDLESSPPAFGRPALNETGSTGVVCHMILPLSARRSALSWCGRARLRV